MKTSPKVEIPSVLKLYSVSPKIFDSKLKLPPLAWSLLERFRNVPASFPDMASFLGITRDEAQPFLFQLLETECLSEVVEEDVLYEKAEIPAPDLAPEIDCVGFHDPSNEVQHISLSID